VLRLPEFISGIEIRHQTSDISKTGRAIRGTITCVEPVKRGGTGAAAGSGLGAMAAAFLHGF
jgi:hypothetical protein